MTNKKSPLTRIKEKLVTNISTPPGKNNGKPYYLFILLIVGVLLMVIGSFWKGNVEERPTAVFNDGESEADMSAETFGKSKNETNSSMKAYEEQYENQLKEALEEIVGVQEVTVVVNVEATERKVFDKNTILKNQTTSEEDKEGGIRKIEDQSTEDELNIIQDGENEVPVVIETRKPEIKGVLIVAGGAENIQVKKWIIEAVTRALDVPSHRVSVVPKKSKGDS